MARGNHIVRPRTLPEGKGQRAEQARTLPPHLRPYLVGAFLIPMVAALYWDQSVPVAVVLVDARAWHAALAELVAPEVELAARAAKLVARAAELAAREAERVVREAEAARLRNEAAKLSADLQRLKRIDLKLEQRR